MIRSIVCRRSFSLSSIRRHYRTTAGSLTVGNFIELNDRLYSVAEIEHVKKGESGFCFNMCINNSNLKNR